MRIKLDYNIFFHLILLYPFCLALITALGKEPFFITAPYFFLVMLYMGFVLLYRKKISFNLWEITQLLLLGLLIVVSLFNFSSLRYSLPILFTVYLFVLQVFLSKYSPATHYTDFKYFRHYLIFYIFLSVFFILVPFASLQQESRFEGFLGSPTVYSAYLVLLYILAVPSFKKNQYKIIFYLVILAFVFLSKTRLMFILTLILPFLYFAIEKWKLSLKKIFLGVFLVLFFLYPVYKVAIDYFPELVTMRYETGRDRSYDLRFYLYVITQEDFLRQDTKTKLLGQGNEHSRLFVKNRIGNDVYPHNDFMRVLNDWGILGSLLLFGIIYRYGTRNNMALMVVIIYLIQFYSNLVFNLFLISILVSISTLSANKPEEPEESYDTLFEEK